MKKIFLSALVLGFTAVLSACQSSSQKASNAPREVNLAIWSNYLTEQQVADFEKQTGIKLNISNYSSNEELLAKLQAGASGYDLVVPSDYMVGVMKELNLAEPLDLAKIPEFKNLDAKVVHKYFDPENKYSVPLDWGTTGIAVNRKLYKGQIKGWKDVFGNKALDGKITMLDDVRETLGAALKAEALSLNSTNPDELARGKSDLLKLKKSLKGFTSETQPGLINGEMAVAHAYSCDALQAQKKTKGEIEYVIPEEGGTFWIDNLVIPKGAQHKEEAHALINYLLDPKVQAARTMNLAGAPSNKEALALLPKEVLENKSLFPDEKTLGKLEMIKDLGAKLPEWDHIWTEVKASQ